MRISHQLVFVVILGLAVAGGRAGLAQPPQLAHAHIGHVMDGFNDTPKAQGLLPTAIAEAQIAAQHAALATKASGDLNAMKLHAAHVLHAIDPTLTENKGPGLGYGLKKAVAAATFHIELAAKEKDASANIKTHAGHVVASNTNVTRRADEIIELGQRIRNSSSAGEAAMLVAQLNTVASQLLAGVDANMDGRVTWEMGEGGLEQSKQHMELMKKGEGR